MTLKSYWKKLLKAVNALQVRERQMIIVAGSVLIIGVFSLVAWEPLYVDWIKKSAMLTQAKENLNQAETTIERIKSESRVDANKPYREKFNKLKNDIEDQDYKIETITAALINPKHMNHVFGTLLKNTELEIDTITNSPAEAIDIQGEGDTDKLLYMHALSLELSGTFIDSLKYLKRIESQNWNLYWDNLVFTTTQYPQGRLILKVHTLSTSDHVLGL